MYIKRVSLKHFKSHLQFEEEFHPGTNAICGPNGAGKTSVVEAIGYALFNHRPPASGNVTELIQKGSKRASILVEFEANLDGRMYVAERKINLSGGGSYAVFDKETGQLMAEKTRDCQDFLRELMQLEQDLTLPQLFETTLGVPQGTIASAFLKNTSERKKIFYPLLRVEEYQIAYKRMRSFLNHLETKQHGFQKTLQARNESIADLTEKENTALTLQQNVQTLQSEHNHLLDDLPIFNEKLENQRIQEQTLHALEQKLERTKESLDRDQQEFSRADHELLLAQNANTIVQQVQSDALEYSSAKQEYELLLEQERNAKELQTTITKHTLNLHSLQEKDSALRSQISSLQALEQEQTRLAPFVLKQSQLEEKILILQKQLWEHQQALKEQKQLQNDQNKLHKKKSQQQELVHELQAIQHTILEKEQIEEKGLLLRESINVLQLKQQKHEALQQQTQTISQECTKKEQQLENTYRNLDKLIKKHQHDASLFEELQDEQRQNQDKIASIQSQMKRENAFQKQINDGCCPYFGTLCKNLPPGKTLDQFISNQQQDSQSLLTHTTSEQKKIETRLANAKKAKSILDSKGQKERIRIEELQNQISSLKEQFHTSKEQLTTCPSRKQDIEQQEFARNQLRHQFKETKANAERALTLRHETTRLEEMQEKWKAQQSRLQEIKDQHKQSISIEANFTNVQNELDSLDNPREKVRFQAQQIQQLPDLINKSKSIQSQQQSLQDTLDQLTKQKKKLNLDPNKQQLIRQRLQRTEQAYQSYLQHKENAEKYPEAHTRINTIKENIKKNKNLITSLEAEKTPLSKQVNTDALASLEKTLQQKRDRSAEIGVLLPEKKKRLEELQNEIQKLTSTKNEIQELKQKYQQLNEVIDCSQTIRQVFQEAGPKITSALIGSISQEANRIFRHLIDHGLIHLRWNENFELILEENGMERSFANLSGGEQMSAALALRLACIRELSNVRIAFFDEPTAHMDQERRRNLAAQLVDIQGFDQLFVISHDDTFEAITDHVVWIQPTA